MKLELKHLAPYLPYDLKCKYLFNTCSGKIIEQKIFTLTEINKSSLWKYWTRDETFTNQIGCAGMGFRSCDFKPILRPLSDLIKEIEVNGEKFVPIIELAKYCYNKIFNEIPILDDHELLSEGDSCGLISYYENERISLTHDKDDRFYSFTFYISGEELKVNQFELFNKLFEWHFDIYNLIENGLAISYNDLYN